MDMIRESWEEIREEPDRGTLELTKLTPTGLKGLLKKPGRHADGQGLYFRSVGDAKAYWVYRYRIGGREREMSLGPYPEITLAEARSKHAAMRKAVIADKIDPLAGKRPKGKTGSRRTEPVGSTGVPTFGAMADQYVETHEGSWRSAKHRLQWRTTLTKYCEPIWDTPVDEIDTKAVLGVLEPLWARAPETASRLRGRIEAVLAAAQVGGHIREDRPSPARWTKWLEHKLPKVKKLANGGHAALHYKNIPALMERLAGIDSGPARALRLTILTACRSGEVLGARWDEIDFDAKTWTVPEERMKANKLHRVPLSDPALELLCEMRKLRRNDHPFVFPGQRPRKGLTHMVMFSVLRQMGVDATTHGMRSSFRDWCTEIDKTEYATAERCLAHAVGSGSALSYDRSDRLELRREVMAKWAAYVCGNTDSNVVPLRSAVMA